MSDRYRLGIDLSTTNIGVCVLEDNNEVRIKGTIKLEPFSFETQKMCINTEVIANQLIRILKDTLFHNGGWPYNLDVGIELSNYNNALLTNRFHFYAGVIYQILWDCMFDEELKKETKIHELKIKFFNANQWMFKCGIRPRDDRNVRKKLVRKFVMEHCERYNDNWTEDECDAYGIAYWLDELKNTDELHEETKKKALDKTKRTWLLYSLERKLNSKLAELASLDKVRNARRIITVTNVIVGLRKEIENVKKKTNSTDSNTRQ